MLTRFEPMSCASTWNLDLRLYRLNYLSLYEIQWLQRITHNNYLEICFRLFLPDEKVLK